MYNIITEVDYVRYTELLIEAIECSQEDWYTEYEPEDARRILNGAINEKPEEHEIATLISLLEPEDNEFEDTSPLKIYRQCLQRLKKDLREINERIYS
jgi:(2Fe-2S) ferredoxin